MRPLVEKIKSSHIQVKQTTASIGVQLMLAKLEDLPSTTPPVSLSPLGGTKDWQPTVTVDEDGILSQKRDVHLQSRNAPVAQTFGSPQQPQSNALLPAIQASIDAITEHQRFNALMKGELIKGLLPQSSVRADYTVHRVQKLAEGMCLKNYDYIRCRGLPIAEPPLLQWPALPPSSPRPRHHGVISAPKPPPQLYSEPPSSRHHSPISAGMPSPCL